MKVNVKLILKTAALVVIIAAFGTCDSSFVSEPAVSFDSVSMTGLSFNQADMKAKIKVRNDNPISIPFPKINWKLFIAENSFLSGIVPEGTKIDAHGFTLVELPFSVPYDGLYTTIATLLEEAEAPYRIDLAVLFDIPVLGSETFDTSFDGTIPLPKMPELSFDGIKFNTPSIIPPKVEFVLTWKVDNKNVFDLNLDKLNYNFEVNSNSWSSGAVPKNTIIPARSLTHIPVTVSIGAGSLFSEIYAIAIAGSTVNYTCNGDISLSPKGFENFATLERSFSFP